MEPVHENVHLSSPASWFTINPDGEITTQDWVTSPVYQLFTSGKEETDERYLSADDVNNIYKLLT